MTPPDALRVMTTRTAVSSAQSLLIPQVLAHVRLMEGDDALRLQLTHLHEGHTTGGKYTQ